MDNSFIDEIKELSSDIYRCEEEEQQQQEEEEEFYDSLDLKMWAKFTFASESNLPLQNYETFFNKETALTVI